MYPILTSTTQLVYQMPWCVHIKDCWLLMKNKTVASLLFFVSLIGKTNKFYIQQPKTKKQMYGDVKQNNFKCMIIYMFYLTGLCSGPATAQYYRCVQRHCERRRTFLRVWRRRHGLGCHYNPGKDSSERRWHDTRKREKIYPQA